MRSIALTLLTVIIIAPAIGCRKPSPVLPADPHHHVVNVHENPDMVFEGITVSMIAPHSHIIKSNMVMNPGKTVCAFIVSGDDIPMGEERIILEDMQSSVLYEILGIPMQHRPFSDLTWAGDRFLIFDRWSNPHFGVHYVVDAVKRKVIISAPFPDSSADQQLEGWLGDYEYDEEPVKALAGYYMAMVWSVKIYKDKSEYLATIEINGQQTYMVIQANVKGNDKQISFLFEKGLDGFGFDYMKKGDTLFELKKNNNQITTHWNTLHPRLLEKHPNDTVCFELKK